MRLSAICNHLNRTIYIEIAHRSLIIRPIKTMLHMIKIDFLIVLLVTYVAMCWVCVCLCCKCTTPIITLIYSPSIYTDFVLCKLTRSKTRHVSLLLLLCSMCVTFDLYGFRSCENIYISFIECIYVYRMNAIG